MSTPPAPRRMAKRRSSQNKPSYAEEDMEDFISDDEPILPKKGSRAKRRSAAADLDESEPEQQDSDSEDENVAGPSSRAKKASKGKKGKAGKAMKNARDEEEEPAAKSKAAANTQKKSRRSTTQAKPGARGAAKSPADAEDSEEYCEEGEDDELLQDAIDHYTYEAGPASISESTLSSGEEGGLVRSIIRFMIFRQQQKPDVPVKRDEVTKLILSNYRGQRVNKQLIPHILKLVAAKFPTALGMEMKEITLKTQTKLGEADGAKVFVLRSLLPAKLRALSKAPAIELNQAFAMVILPLIALTGGKMSEADLGTQLEKLGITMTHDNPVLGKPTDQLQELVNKKLLAKSREAGGDGVQNMYAINSLAHENITEDKLKAFIDQVFVSR